MTEWETLGVRFIFDGKQGFAGLEEYKAGMGEANKITQSFTTKTDNAVTKVTNSFNKNFKGLNKTIITETKEVGDSIETVSTTYATTVDDIAASQARFFAPIRESNAALREGTQTVATWSAEVEDGVLTVQKTFTAGMPEATKSVETFKQNVDGAMTTVRRSFKETADSAEKDSKKYIRSFKETADSAEKDSKKYIRSIALIYAIFRQGPQLAADFGEALRGAVAGKAVRDSFYRLGDAVEVNSDRLLKAMKEASRGTVAEIELMRIANRAFLAGGEQFAEALPELFQIARAAAVATNKDLKFVFDTLVTGIARASPKLIDNAEIYLKIGNAVEEYAEKTGRAVDEISAQEKIQATLSAVLRDGQTVIQNVGADMDVATDSFDRARTSINDFKQSALEALNDAFYPLGPVLYGIGDTLNEIAPILQTIALLKFAGAGSLLNAIAGAGAIGTVATGFAGLVSVLGGVKLGMEGYDAALQLLNRDGPRANDILDMTADIVQHQVRIWTEGQDAADEWFRSVNNIKTLAQINQEAEDAQKALLDQVGLGPDAYNKYIAVVDLYNRTLERGQLAIPLLTRDEFELQQILSNNGPLKDRIEALDRLQQRIDNLPPILRTLLAELVRNENYNLKVAYAAERAAEAEAELTKQLEIQARFRVLVAEGQKRRLEGLLEITGEMQKINAKIRELEAEATADIERESQERQSKIWRREIDALHDREDAYIQFQRSVRDAERDRVRAIEDINRQHKRRLEDIEYDYQRRIQEIEYNFQRTVQEAADDRDALAIFRAQQRRQDELRDAGIARQDQIRDEQRDFQERLLQAERTYQDRLERARQSLRDELADIQRKLQRELQLERQADQQRLADQKAANDAEIEEERRKYRTLEAELRAYVGRARRIIGGLPRWFQPKLTPTDPTGTRADSGFEGVVQGPFNLGVGPGVKEYIYASGDLRGGRQPIIPSAAAAQVQGVRAAVSGGVGVGLSGFSQDLVNRIGPALREQVGQAIIDEMTDAILAGL